MIVPSERTEVVGASLTRPILAALAVERPRARHGRPDAGGRGEGRVAVRAPAGTPREWPAGVRTAALVATVVALVGDGVGLLLDRPPDEPDRRDDRHLQREHEIDEGPVHPRARCYSDRPAGSSPRVARAAIVRACRST